MIMRRVPCRSASLGLRSSRSGPCCVRASPSLSRPPAPFLRPSPTPLPRSQILLSHHRHWTTPPLPPLPPSRTKPSCARSARPCTGRSGRTTASEVRPGSMREGRWDRWSALAGEEERVGLWSGGAKGGPSGSLGRDMWRGGGEDDGKPGRWRDGANALRGPTSHCRREDLTANPLRNHLPRRQVRLRNRAERQAYATRSGTYPPFVCPCVQTLRDRLRDLWEVSYRRSRGGGARRFPCTCSPLPAATCTRRSPPPSAPSRPRHQIGETPMSRRWTA